MCISIICVFFPVVLYAIFASYFAGVMVRLMLTLTPIVCVAAAIAFSKAFEIYLKDDTPKSNSKPALDTTESKADSKYYDKVSAWIANNMIRLVIG